MVVSIGVGVRAVPIGNADIGRTDRVVESCMAVRARALQLVVVLMHGVKKVDGIFTYHST